MVFSSISFLFYFLPAVLIAYYAMPSRALKNGLLILASLFFYAWGEPVWVTLMLISAATDYFCGRIIGGTAHVNRKRGALIVSLVVNLGLLGFFKYHGFFFENLNGLFALNLPYHHIALPIGISFYTFQTLSYTIDVYRGRVTVQRNFLNFLLFVSLFPQLVAGPIVRYADVAAEIDGRRESFEQFSEGVSRFCRGLGKKIILANTTGQAAAVFLNAPATELTVVGAWLGILLFAFQIYFDFSGYSDMAIGLGHMFGFHFKENFNYPYIAQSAGEFWRRWHMSLGSFFRDYLYIPLGGNKKHFFRNMAIVWFLTGLWHGAGWNFILWGLYFGVLILLERTVLKGVMARLPRILRHVYLILAVLVGWVFFYFVNLSAGLRYLKVMSGLSGRALVDAPTLLHLQSILFLLVAAAVLSTPVVKAVQNRLGAHAHRAWVASVQNLVLLAISAILLVGQSYNPFLYFRF